MFLVKHINLAELQLTNGEQYDKAAAEPNFF
jgi:hypothetical protein